MSHIPEEIDSKYRYVLLASNRAEQLVQGAVPNGDPTEVKPTRIAMSEISEKLVDWGYGPGEEAAEEGAEAAADAGDADAEPETADS